MRSILLFSCCCLTHLPPPGGGLLGSSQKPSRLSSPPCLSINHFEPTVRLFAHSALHRRRRCDGPRRHYSSLSLSHWSPFPPHATPLTVALPASRSAICLHRPRPVSLPRAGYDVCHGSGPQSYSPCDLSPPRPSLRCSRKHPLRPRDALSQPSLQSLPSE
jgi:hypothetical protein